MISRKQPKKQPKASNQLLHNAIASLLILQALFMIIKGNLDVLSGKSPFDVVPGMINQGIALLLKAEEVKKKDASSKNSVRRHSCSDE